MKIAHAGHAELLVTNLAASKKFFTETMGLFVTEEDATSVYLPKFRPNERQCARAQVRPVRPGRSHAPAALPD